MNETIKIQSFTPSTKSKTSDKTVPALIIDGNDRRFAVDRSLVDFIRSHVGQSLEIEFTEKQNGQWTNRLITAAVEPKAPTKTGWQPKSPEERREIIRQTALKASVEMYAALYQGVGKDSGLTTKPILKMAEVFADWVQREHTLPEGPVPEIPW